MLTYVIIIIFYYAKNISISSYNYNRLIELTFLVGENRTRNTHRRLSHPSSFNEIMKKIKVTREFPRRARELDFSVLKALEMRNIILFFFPIIVQCIEQDARERRLWFLLAFLIRACTLPNEEFNQVNKNEISNACKNFYALYESLFSNKNCTYSIHVLASHILKIRGSEPLTAASAFIFESFYGEMRRSFVPGTVSTVKQIMTKIYLKRILSYHCCEKTIFYSAKETPMEQNCLIYLFQNNIFTMYKIVETDKDNPNVFYCNIQGKVEIEFPEAADVDWSSVGVFKQGALGSEIYRIERKNIAGKVIKVCSLLITCPINVLNER